METNKKKLLGVGAAAVATFFFARKMMARKQGGGRKRPELTPEQKKRLKIKKNAMGTLWKLLLPKRPFANGEDGQGSYHILFMVFLCLVRVGLMNATSNLVGLLDRVMMTRNQNDFWRCWLGLLGVALASSLHRQTYKYVESSLGAIWYEKLSGLVNRRYFREMNYYALSQGAASKTGNSIPDPVERITNDVKDVSKEMALVFCEGMYTATAGGFFAYKLGKLYGIRYALAPYIYLWSGIILTQILVPVNWGKLYGNLKGLFSNFKESVERVVLHHEAIRSLEGGEYEESLILQRLGNWAKAVGKFNKTVIMSGFADQLVFYWWLRTFVSWFVIGPHVVAPRKQRELNSIEDLAQLRGAIGHQFVMFIQSMIAAGVSAKMVRQVQRLSGGGGRVAELLAELKELEDGRGKKAKATMKEGDYIAFENVQIVTPDNNLLVENLSFVLKKGESLLLTGHNGAGKSSIFRCLGGLWNAEGTIIKPGSAESGLHQEVYYLPQKPYTVLGTLADQLTYPEKKGVRQPLSAQEVKEILEHVGLAHLVSREGAMEEERDWERSISLGERQRLAIARLLYHKPSFAILDECTSAVSSRMERKLYNICSELKISYITISHRPVLRAFHTHQLTIGIGEGNYTYEALPPSSSLSSSSSSSSLLEKDHPKIEEQKEEEEKKEEQEEEKKPKQGKITTLLRLFRLLRGVLGKGKGKEGMKFVAKVVGYVVGVVIQAKLVISHVLCTSGMMSCVFSAEGAGKRKSEFFRLCVKGGLIGLAVTAVEQFLLFLQRDLSLSLTHSLSRSLVCSFMENHTFYELIQMGKVGDPGQRIAQDVRDLSTRLTDFLPLVRPIVEIMWFSTRIYALVGNTASSMFAAYLIGGATLIRLFMPNFTKIVARESQLEGEYNLVHYRTHNHAESIAFFGGDECEKEVVQTRFRRLMNAIWRKLKTNWYFGLVNQAIVREAPMLVQFLLRNSYGQNWGSDAELTKDAGRSLNHAQLFLFNATQSVFDGLGQLLGGAEMVAQLCGVAERVLEAEEALKEVKKEDRSQDVADATVVEQGTIGFNNATIITPKNKTLARNLTVKITPETPLLVTGPNGSGKTFFVRCLAQMWPLSDETKGEVIISQEKEEDKNQKSFFVVPQAVYMVDGSLFDQLTYPLHISRSKRTEEVKKTMNPLLELVGIPYLLERHGWDEEKKWEDILSLGEQQRMGMARLFYHSPKFGILDECTSAVSVDVEERLYRHAREMGITCVTISQRLALQEFHTQELRLGDLTENKWSLHSTQE